MAPGDTSTITGRTTDHADLRVPLRGVREGVHGCGDVAGVRQEPPTEVPKVRQVQAPAGLLRLRGKDEKEVMSCQQGSGSAEKLTGCVVREGEVLHVITRRKFASDVRQHFVGKVQAVAGWIVRLEGYAFVFDAGQGAFRKRPDVRLRLISLGDCGNVISVIPHGVKLSDLTYEMREDEGLVLTDRQQFKSWLREFAPDGPTGAGDMGKTERP